MKCSLNCFLFLQELQNFEQFIFADYTNFVQVENVYENILLNLLYNEVNKGKHSFECLRHMNNFKIPTSTYSSIFLLYSGEGGSQSEEEQPVC